MGQLFSDQGVVEDGIKAQASGGGKIYGLLNFTGGGKFVDYMKEAKQTNDYALADQRIKEDLVPFLYNNGDGLFFSNTDIIKMRAREIEKSDMRGKAVLDEGEYFKLGDVRSQYKKLCWKLDEMGAVGETALHVCLLNSTSLHADLAKRLLRNFPMLINDIYVSDEYFGENVLHMAIVNEDPAMVKFLLDNGCDYHQRACGNFFTADDQKSKKKNNFDHEWFDLPVETNYVGYTYWGEYPLGFAACLGQEHCVRLLVAKGADPNLVDSNGCTVLHMLVVHDNKMRERTEVDELAYMHPEEMFDLLVDLGGKLHVMNNQGMTPLTLSAKLGRKDMYEHILDIEREIFWVYGNITCAAYPLEHIDTISITGEINTNSVMYHIIYGDEPEHLSMIDGIISQLLEEKWKTFARYRFKRRFVGFIFYFIIFFVGIIMRPGTDTSPTTETITKTDVNGTAYNQTVTNKDPCYLLRYDDTNAVLRCVFEIGTLLGAMTYIFLSLKEVYHQGYRIFFQTLTASPAKTCFLFSNIFVILTVPGRAACAYVYEDVMIVFAILTGSPYFLFFCRGFSGVGPSVVMIYKMIRTDLLRFFLIYLVFVIGFSQSYFIMFVGMEGTMFEKPWEAIMAVFLFSLGDFG